MSTNVSSDLLAESNDTVDLVAAYRKIISLIVGTDSEIGSCCIDIPRQFQTSNIGPLSSPRNMNAAFLIALAGKRHPRYQEAREFLDEMEVAPLWSRLAAFYKKGLERLPQVFSETYEKEGPNLVDRALAAHNCGDHAVLQEAVWHLFNPESTGIMNDREGQTAALRDRRKVMISKLNERPIHDVAQEVIFTSNVLITLPSAHKGSDELDISDALRNSLDAVYKEEQLFWYDHPVQIGVETEKNEIVYGLKHLFEAVQYEKNRGTIDKDSEITCILEYEEITAAL